MNSIDQQFIEYIVKSLVSDPDAVKIERRIDEKGVLLELTVAQEDLGRVIGKRGATAQSLRTLLRALGTKNDARYNLKIIDVGGPRPPRDDNQPTSVQPSSDDPADEQTESKTADTTAKDVDRTPEAPKTSKKSEGASPAAVEEPKDDLEDAEDKAARKEEGPSDLATRTRAELADLDDLDV